jgi:hypothetical protein
MSRRRNPALTAAIRTVRGAETASATNPQLDKVGDVIITQAEASFAVRIVDPS